jgi:hypothetical protein
VGPWPVCLSVGLWRFCRTNVRSPADPAEQCHRLDRGRRFSLCQRSSRLERSQRGQLGDFSGDRCWLYLGGHGSQKSGASAWFAEMLAPLLIGLPFAAVLFVMVFHRFCPYQLMNNVAWWGNFVPFVDFCGTCQRDRACAAGCGRACDGNRLHVACRLGPHDVGCSLWTVSAREMARSGLWVGLPSVAGLVCCFFCSVCSG